MIFDNLRSLLHYIPRFRGRTFVVMLEGEIIASPNFPLILQDLAVLHSVGMRLVLVFGARHQIIELATARGFVPSSADGLGVTDKETLDVSIQVVSTLAMELLQGLTSVNLHGAVINAMTAHPTGIVDGVELQHTGSVDKIDEGLLAAAIERDLIPIIPPIGFERLGGMLRLNSTAVACRVGVELKAEKILLLVPESLTRDGQRLRELSITEAKQLGRQARQKSEISRAYQIRMAVEAVTEGVSRVHFVDGRVEEALLGELFSFHGTGTMIYDKPYRHIRPARRQDIPNILSLIQNAVEDQELVVRTKEDIKKALHDYFVLEVDHSLVGVVSLTPYPSQHFAELGCLYIRRSHEGQGYGAQLVSYAEEKARTLHAKTLLALSTQAYRYFVQKFGFRIGSPADLPEERRVKWERSGRNSQVLLKDLE